MSATRRTIVTGAAALLLAGIAPVAAGELPAYDAAAFEAAQAAGKPILIHVTAPWCGTCQRQKPILSRLSEQPDFGGFAMFNVDFQSQKDTVKRFEVRYQTTMIVFKGGEEIGRSLGDTNPESIEGLLRKAL